MTTNKIQISWPSHQVLKERSVRFWSPTKQRFLETGTICSAPSFQSKSHLQFFFNSLIYDGCISLVSELRTFLQSLQCCQFLIKSLGGLWKMTSDPKLGHISLAEFSSNHDMIFWAGLASCLLALSLFSISYEARFIAQHSFTLVRNL